MTEDFCDVLVSWFVTAFEEATGNTVSTDRRYEVAFQWRDSIHRFVDTTYTHSRKRAIVCLRGIYRAQQLF